MDNSLRKQYIFWSLIVLFATNFGFSQLSDLHYLPPLKQGQNNAAIEQQRIYLSTPETNAFLINVYRGTNTTPITTYNISKTTPAVYNPGNGNNNITLVNDANTGIKLTNSGLRFESPGGQNFYVNYRGQSTSQAASLTSKGRIALGTNFKWGGVPNLGNEVSKSNTLGIMATADNTVITLSGYDPNCEFRVAGNRAGIIDDSYTITLNKNESFVFETYIGTSPTLAHERGWIGASIDADKDIAISNGSLNYGREVGSTNRDAGIDQPVPENRLGKEYVFIRGNGNVNGWTEFPLIIATQNNTQIFVNGSTTPITTINEGEFFEIPSSNFSSNTVGSNMLVVTSKDAYAYQCVGGSTDAYTQGLNFVAPISCLLPDNMDNIPNITDVAGVTITGGVTIIAATTTADSNITVIDGSGTVTLPPSLAVTGTTDWKTFYLPSLTGNVSVQSTGPIAVGFFGFNGARGVAGYYSGFDTVPDVDLQISGTNCLPGAFLEVSNGEVFDAYQWYNGDGLIAGETSTTYSPTTAGDYFLRVTKGPCSYDSNPIAVFYCNPEIVINKSIDTSTALEGDTVNFTITIESWGIDPVTNLVVTDILPSGFTFVSASPSKGTWSTPNWTIGTVNSSDLETIVITATVNNLSPAVSSQTITNTATHTQDQVDTNSTADSPSASILINSDNDGDGVLDVNDLDDDNDGILDTVEFSCAPPVAGFDAYWPLNNSTNDLSGNNHNQITGNVSFSATSKCGLASASFNGSSDFIQYSDGTYLNQQITNFTYSFWVKPNSFSGNQTLVDEGGSGNGLGIRLSNNSLQSTVREDGTQINSPDITFPNDGLWHHIALTYESGILILYLDGVGTVPVNTGFGALAAHGSHHAFGFTNNGDGFGPGSGNYYDGLMDEILHYPISLTATEINSLVTEIYWDTDNDGTADYLDTDSDNDGCSDADEAYAAVGTDSNNDGTYGGVITNTAVNTNGLVISAGINGAGDTYTTTPAISTISTNYTFQEVGTAPSISIEPEDEKVILPNDGTFDLTTTGNTYQWQVSSDAGASYNDINDGAAYSGTTTVTLTVISPDLSKNGYLYRVVVTDSNYVCGESVSDAAVLTIGPRTVITNRRITFRVKKN